jgi:corrinoid protein of di/trimethylamine methyltransferase
MPQTGSAVCWRPSTAGLRIGPRIHHRLRFPQSAGALRYPRRLDSSSGFPIEFDWFPALPVRHDDGPDIISNNGVTTMDEYLAECKEAVLEGDRDRAMDLAARALADGFDVLDVIEHGFSVGIREAGQLWEQGVYFLPELAFSAESMKAAMETLRPALLADGEGEGGRSKGTVVIGTVQGDIHDIGKTLVATMLAANGYNVVDLGADVAHERFVSEVEAQNPDMICMSALLTTTMAGQKTIIDMLAKAGLRDRVKVLIGGAPATNGWANDIGADGYADNAVAAVHKADELLS